MKRSTRCNTLMRHVSGLNFLQSTRSDQNGSSGRPDLLGHKDIKTTMR